MGKHPLRRVNERQRQDAPFLTPTMSSSNFTPTPSESALVNRIFTLFDTQKFGVLTGEVAVKAFAGANLSPTLLGEIWNIADEDNNGWLSRKGVSIAIRLIGWAQKGEKMSKDLLGRRKSCPPCSSPSLTRPKLDHCPLLMALQSYHSRILVFHYPSHLLPRPSLH